MSSFGKNPGVNGLNLTDFFWDFFNQVAIGFLQFYEYHIFTVGRQQSGKTLKLFS